MIRLRNAFLVACLASSVTLPSVASAAQLEGQNFDDKIRVAQGDLVLNGLGLRSLLFFKVYVAGLYLPAKSADATHIISSQTQKRLQLNLLRELEAQSLVDAFEKGLKANHSETELAALKPKIDQLKQTMLSIGAAKAGDKVTMDFEAGQGFKLAVNGAQKGALISGPEIQSAVLRVFLGAEPADSGLKRGLLGGT